MQDQCLEQFRPVRGGPRTGFFFGQAVRGQSASHVPNGENRVAHKRESPPRRSRESPYSNEIHGKPRADAEPRPCRLRAFESVD